MIELTPIQAVEWSGSLIGLAGAALLALNTRISRWGWVAFLASNVLMLVMAASLGLRGVFLMQAGFTFTSLLGIWRSFGRQPKPAAPAPTSLTMPLERLRLDLNLREDGRILASAQMLVAADDLEADAVQRWLASRGMVAQPAGFDFRLPVKAGTRES